MRQQCAKLKGSMKTHWISRDLSARAVTCDFTAPRAILRSSRGGKSVQSFPHRAFPKNISVTVRDGLQLIRCFLLLLPPRYSLLLPSHERRQLSKQSPLRRGRCPSFRSKLWELGHEALASDGVHLALPDRGSMLRRKAALNYRGREIASWLCRHVPPGTRCYSCRGIVMQKTIGQGPAPIY